MRMFLALTLALLGASSPAVAAPNAARLAALGQFSEAFTFVLKEYYVEPDSQAMLAAAYRAMVETYAPHDAALKGRNLAGGDVTGALARFGDGFDAVKARAGSSVSNAALIGVALKEMLASLDPRNEYYDPAEFSRIRQGWSGEIVGIGVEIAKDDDAARVVVPLDGSPAARAGLSAGDRIVAIDGNPVGDLTLAETTNRLRGTAGAKVRLTIRREGLAAPVEVTITRARVQIRLTRHEIIDGIGYIRIVTFNGKVADALQQTFADLKKAAKSPLRGYVLDLRNNAGGLFDQVVAVADAFLDDGLIVAIGNRAGAFERYPARKGVVAPAVPIVILVNASTTSGAEIVAAALQDHARAVIVGSQTRGDALSGVVRPLTGGGAIRLMTAQFHRPSGKALHAVGVAPDHVVRSDPGAGPGIPADRSLDRPLRFAIALLAGKPLPEADAKPPAAATARSSAATGDAGFDDLEDLGTLD